MVTTETGRAAERAVAIFLGQSGHKVLAKNWRRPRCEIDVITEKDRVVFFTEVKYRASAAQGGGFEHVTGGKQKQMDYAARHWCLENGWDGDWRLLAASVTGPDYSRIEIVEL